MPLTGERFLRSTVVVVVVGASVVVVLATVVVVVEVDTDVVVGSASLGEHAASTSPNANIHERVARTTAMVRRKLRYQRSLASPDT